MSDSASTQGNTPNTGISSEVKTEKQPQEQQQLDAEVPTKPDYPSVFVGNLNFQTTEGELKDYFSSAGEVREVHIITRGPRSMGYGFVAFTSQEAADKAVQTLNKTFLADREINVEVARPMPEGTQAHRRTRRFRGRRRMPIGRGSQPMNLRRRRFPVNRRRPSQSGPRVESDNVAYISNLPFSTTVDELVDFFHDFNITDTHIPVRPRSRKSKGFGFVTFASHEEQQRAVKYFLDNKSDLQGRPISVSVAFELPNRDEQNKNGLGQDDVDNAPDDQKLAEDADNEVNDESSAPAPAENATKTEQQ